MPITIKTAAMKARESVNDPWETITVKAEAELETVWDITGDGNLDPGFTATDLTGAVNELKTSLNAIGTVYTGTNAASLTVPTGTNTIVCSVNLPAGVYVIVGGFEWTASFSQASNGVILQGTSIIEGTFVRGTGDAGGGYNASCIINIPSSGDTINLRGRQDSGSDKTAQRVTLKAIKIA